MAKIGYARVSTRSQNDDSQVDDLTAYGCGGVLLEQTGFWSRPGAVVPTARRVLRSHASDLLLRITVLRDLRKGGHASGCR